MQVVPLWSIQQISAAAHKVFLGSISRAFMPWLIGPTPTEI
jgi:hypothetical protein